MIRARLAAALFSLAAAPALAEAGEGAAETIACPENAAQIVFNMHAAIELGVPTALEKVYETAEIAATRCPGSSDIQGLAALLFVSLAGAVEDPDTQLTLFSKAYDAALRTDHTFDSGTGTAVTGGDGAEVKLYLYGPVFTALESVIIPQLAILATTPGRERVHPIFAEEAPLAAYPYTANRGSGVEYEARGLSGASTAPGAVGAISARLLRLQAACPKRAAYFDWALAAYFNRAAYANEFRPGEARKHARAALAHAAAFSRAAPATRGSDADKNADFLSRMTVNLRDKFPDLDQ
ncbi:MAG: hypothetical protein C0456_04770 [Hyphomonas sp.]|uniref:hypothetical protein n=1 Tax=Hyphomonas sp. TaxID=87 RepID=UPI001D49AF02|nr:hypothetical protein [Hyphomonas sp.]MBA4225925.1 hypothetical protein [Hyphomonas sp.]